MDEKNKSEMPEGNVIPDAAGMKPILVIGVNPEGKLMAVGPFQHRDYCIALLADTIKFALSVQTPQEQNHIIVPKVKVNIPKGGLQV